MELAPYLTIEAQGKVDGREVLYRLVKHGYKELKSGEWKPSTSAFLGGPRNRVSVNRAQLCGNDPSSTREDKNDYVCRLVTGDVRGIDNITRTNPEDGHEELYEMCVESTPQPGNDAHADTYAHPPAPNKSAQRTVFRRVKEELAELAKWETGFGPSDREEA